MLLPVSRQTPTWSLPTRFKTASSSSARQSLWFSTASRMPCRATTGAARLRAWADDSANRRNAAAVANVSYRRPESMTVRTTSAPARFAVRISASNRSTSAWSRGRETIPSRYIEAATARSRRASAAASSRAPRPT